MAKSPLHLRDPHGAMIAKPTISLSGPLGGPLSDLRFAVKDLFDVAGVPTAAGSPDWPETRPLPQVHAVIVSQLLDAGATLIGKTITDEISLGILGENKFDGTPENPACPGRVPGGSSAGSAAAVAGDYCDFALGSDTGGSVRVPASFCGIYGIRPTHGRLNLEGLMPQAPSSDTAGWFARSAETLSRVGRVLYQEDIPNRLNHRLLIARDAFAFSGSETQTALTPVLNRLSKLFREVAEVDMAPNGLEQWSEAQRTVQAAEFWQTFSEWIDHHNPRLSYSVARNLFIASRIESSSLESAQLVKQQATEHMTSLLPRGTLLCLPTTPFCAPRVNLPIHQTDALRLQISVLCSHGGLTGVPHVSIPGATTGPDHAPIGLSIIAGHNHDTDLLAASLALEAQRD